MLISILLACIASIVLNAATLWYVTRLVAPRQQLFLLQEIVNLAIAMSDQMTEKHRLPRERRLDEAMSYARELTAHLGLHVKDATLRKTIEAALNRR